MIFDPSARVVRTHCHSEFNGPWDPATPPEREKSLEYLFSCADFAEIEIVAFSINPTSFDIILDTPREVKISRKEMLSRLEKITAPAQFEIYEKELLARNPAAWARLTGRFGDVSSFIKQLKMLLAKNYHRTHGTSGTLWNSRFSSAFVQTGHASRILSAWMDHASIRSGENSKPDEDRFSTFGCAVAGNERARAMMTRLFGSEDASTAWRDVARIYRAFIQEDVPTTRAPRAINGVQRLSRPQLLLTEVPHFRGGLAFGDEAFVENFFQLNKHEFGPNRTRGGHPLTGQNDPDLWTIRQKIDLRRL